MPMIVARQHLANRPCVVQEAQLRGPQVLTRPAEVQDESMSGGLRRSHRAVKLIPNGAAAGLKLEPLWTRTWIPR